MNNIPKRREHEATDLNSVALKNSVQEVLTQFGFMQSRETANNKPKKEEV